MGPQAQVITGDYSLGLLFNDTATCAKLEQVGWIHHVVLEQQTFTQRKRYRQAALDAHHE
jgi:hypothetical protein